jgi:hypothetical protein
MNRSFEIGFAFRGNAEQEARMEERNTKQNAKENALPKLSSAEQAALDKYLLRSEAKPFVRINVSDSEDGPKLVADRSNKLHELIMKAVGSDDPEISKNLKFAFLMDAVGSADPKFLDGILRQLIGYSSEGPDLNEDKLNFLLSVISGLEPRDQFEAMLAAQMAVVHVASMEMACRLPNWGKIDEVAERAVNKFNRTFVLQLEALTRYRAGAKQKITFQQVSVTDGGQAIVGNVTQAPRQSVTETGAAPPPPASTATNVVPMPGSKKRAPFKARRTATK